MNEKDRYFKFENDIMEDFKEGTIISWDEVIMRINRHTWNIKKKFWGHTDEQKRKARVRYFTRFWVKMLESRGIIRLIVGQFSETKFEVLKSNLT